MDQVVFDRIARALGGAVSRRSGLLAALAGLAGLAGAGGAAAKRKPVVEGPCGDRSRKDNICTKDSQ
ncbi:MAG: hypothetical protein ACR2J8_11280, partial [Thermomicrobiales bacterium]